MKITLERAISLSQAAQMISENDLLNVTVAYWVGRLGDKCLSIAKSSEKRREAIRKPLAEKIDALQKEMKSATNEEEKKSITEQIAKINEEFKQKIDELMQTEEEIEINRELKLSDFKAKEEILVIDMLEGKKVERKIKPGQTLVPVGFFSLMGDLILNDEK